MKRFYSIYIGFMFMSFLLLGCLAIQQTTKGQVTQGIQGQIFEQKGNQMPQIGKPISKGKGYATQLFIFEPTSIQSATQLSGSVFKKPSTQLIGSYETDSLGHYKIHLKPGKYSFFVGYQNEYYATSFNQLNELGIVQVLPGTFATIDVIISAKASY